MERKGIKEGKERDKMKGKQRIKDSEMEDSKGKGTS